MFRNQTLYYNYKPIIIIWVYCFLRLINFYWCISNRHVLSCLGGTGIFWHGHNSGLYRIEFRTLYGIRLKSSQPVQHQHLLLSLTKFQIFLIKLKILNLVTILQKKYWSCMLLSSNLTGRVQKCTPRCSMQLRLKLNNCVEIAD